MRSLIVPGRYISGTPPFCVVYLYIGGTLTAYDHNNTTVADLQFLLINHLPNAVPAKKREL